MEEFKTFKDFYSDYLTQIEKEIPEYKSILSSSGGYKAIHRSLSPISSMQVWNINRQIKSIQKIPKNIFLVYDKTATTFYSWFNPKKKRLEIAYPTITKFWIKYPTLLKIAIQHELGHILNRDVFVDTRGHGKCANLCMDLRINNALPSEVIEQITKSLFEFTDVDAEVKGAVTPERLFPKYGLSLKGQNYSFEVIHEAFHSTDTNNQDIPQQIQDLEEQLDSLSDDQFGDEDGGGEDGQQGDGQQGDGQQGDGQQGDGQQGDGQQGDGQQGDGQQGDGQQGDGQQGDEVTELNVKRSINRTKKSVGKISDHIRSENPELAEKCDEIVDRLDELKEDVSEGKYDGKLNEALAKRDALHKEAVDKLKDLRKQVKDKINQHREERNETLRGAHTCGTIEGKPEASEADKAIAESIVDNIIEEIKDNPIDYDGLSQLSSQPRAGSQTGNTLGNFEVVDRQIPDWIREVSKHAKAFKRRRKTRRDIDIEEMGQSSNIKKEKVKAPESERSVLAVLDTSGSMWGYQWNGVALIDLMVSYMFPIWKKYEGQLWQVDTSLKLRTDFKNLKDDYNIQISGRGGTAFGSSFEKIKEIKETRVWYNDDGTKVKLKGEQDFLTILFTDAGVSWDFHFPDNFIILIPSDMADYAPKNLDPSKNQHLILIDHD